MNTFPLHALIALCTTTSTYAQEETATLICMAVGFATAGAPNSSATARTTGPFPGRRTCSLLKPNSRSSISTRSDAAPRTINASTAGVASTVATKVHLDNLDRVLFKPPLPPTGSRDQHPASDHDHQTSRPPSDDRRAGADHFGEGQGRLMNTGRLRFIPPIALLRKQEAADEIMSPRSLNHLQHLLSKSPRPSPRSNIASRWRLLHGANAWAGLLDPLDEDLRRELVRYGDLVQAAYHAFHSLPSTPSSPSTRHRHLILPDRSYRATKSLFATSSLDFSSLAGPASLPGWLTQRSSWIGYVAVCENEREVRRMGRRDIVIVLRGTSTCLEWAENFRASLVPLDQSDDQRRAPHVPMVARGFRSLYKTPGERVPSLSSAVVDEVRRLMELYKGEELSITLTGHSLGAALAVLLADELSECCGGQDAPPISVVSFGGPRVGNRAFTERIEARGVNVLRVVNEHDVVTRVPALPRVAGGYEHVGAELRVDNRCSPYLIPDADPACCHDLEAYLHLVDGFAGTGCPFRSDAKRSLSRLLDLQESNVKAVYRRARTHGLINPVGVHVPVRSDERGCLPSPSSLIN